METETSAKKANGDEKRGRHRAPRKRGDQPLWDCTNIADYLGVHVATVRRWIAAQNRIGRVIRKTEEGIYYAIPSELDAALKR